MKAILVEVKGGLVIRVATLTNSPKEGVIIVDHDDLDASSDIDTIFEEVFENFYEPDGDSEDFNDFKKGLYNDYK